MESILVVDDSPLNTEVIKSNLVTAGYNVLVAANGADAIALFKDKGCDLILLDIMMPGMNGFDTCTQIRALPQGADVPIVFLSALKDLESHQKALDAGGDDVLTKPIHRSELVLRARSMIWLKRLRSELRSGYNLISSQRDALIRAQAQKQELIDLIVHDLKSPLQVVNGYAQRLEMRPDVASNAEIKEMTSRILTSTDMMYRMVVNLLDISQSENGTLKPTISAVDLAKLAREAVEAMTVRAQQRGIVIEALTPRTATNVPADASLLRRLLDNLLDNALRYTPQKGKVSVEIKESTVDSAVLIGVRDEGPGIPKNDRRDIFEKYFRLDNGSGDKSHASHNFGLGLTFCRLAAQAHGGRIWIEDNEPKGTCFWVAIPCEASSPDAAPAVLA